LIGCKKKGNLNTLVCCRDVNNFSQGLKFQLRQQSSLPFKIHFFENQKTALSSNSQEKIETIALTLGYTDRTTFERFFRARFQKSPSELRKLANTLRFSENTTKLKQLIHSFPPLPNSCQALISASQNDTLTVQKALDIIDQDPIFSARILGLANKAIYARKPKDLRDAIASNIGIHKLVELAVLFATKDTLHNAIVLNTDSLIQSMILTPRLLKEVSKNLEPVNNQAQIDQVCMYAPIGIAVLCHKSLSDSLAIDNLLLSCRHLLEFSTQLNTSFGVDFYSTSCVLLSNWGLNEEVIALLACLDKPNKKLLDEKNRINMIFSIVAMWAVIHNEEECKPLMRKVADRFSIEEFEHLWDFAVTLKQNFNQ
jgi:HD-like signal output (HDOD) protein